MKHKCISRNKAHLRLLQLRPGAFLERPTTLQMSTSPSHWPQLPSILTRVLKFLVPHFQILNTARDMVVICSFSCNVQCLFFLISNKNHMINKNCDFLATFVSHSSDFGSVASISCAFAYTCTP